jgi:hypothetical protein
MLFRHSDLSFSVSATNVLSSSLINTFQQVGGDQTLPLKSASPLEIIQKNSPYQADVMSVPETEPVYTVR